jgi:hypothetical protein
MELSDAPRGFKIIETDDRSLEIHYRTQGMGCMAIFFAFWLTGWTAGCVFMTANVFYSPSGSDLILALFTVPFWVAEIFTIAFVAWLFGSVTQFKFGSDELRVERSLWWYRRSRIITRNEITAVRQVKDGGEDEDSFPSWALTVVGPSEVQVLWRQPIEKSNWLGPIIAQWAGVSFEPHKESKDQKPDSK